MKKFGLFISIALLTAFVGCDSDDVEDPVVPAVSKPVVAVSENTQMCIRDRPEIDSMVLSGYTVDAYKADSVSKSFIYFYIADSVPRCV